MLPCAMRGATAALTLCKGGVTNVREKNHIPPLVSLNMPTVSVRKLAFYALPALAAFVAFALVLAACGTPTPTPECLEPQDGTLVPAECVAPTGSGEEPPPPPPPPPPTGPSGSDLFKTVGCGGCHTIEGVSPGQVGPDLTHVGGRADADYLRQSILEPDAVIASECPGGACPPGVMPQSFGEVLTAGQVDTLVDYLISLQ